MACTQSTVVHMIAGGYVILVRGCNFGRRYMASPKIGSVLSTNL